MKTYYIYLVTIKHPKGPYYYVGSHVWDGDGIDPLYHGSCYYGSNNGLVYWDKSTCSKVYRDWCLKYGYEIKILEKTTKLKSSSDEIKWIDFIMKLVGSKLRDEKVNVSPELLKYKSGLCLNGRLGGTEILNSDSSRRKAIQTRLKNGSLIKAQKAATEASRSEAARNKSKETRRANATKVNVWRNNQYIGELNNPELCCFLKTHKGNVSSLIHRAKVDGKITSEKWNVTVEYVGHKSKISE